MLRASGLTFGAVIALIMALGFGAQGIVGGEAITFMLLFAQGLQN